VSACIFCRWLAVSPDESRAGGLESAQIGTIGVLTASMLLLYRERS